MLNMVKGFKELTPEFQKLAGGKGFMLAKMFQNGYPVPEGFVILPSAFQGGKLKDEAWNEIKVYINTLKAKKSDALFAVRSSALSEDSASASFAGEFETVLNVKTEDEILDAIYRVFRSGESERVKAYSTVHGFEHSHQIAIVIMQMVVSEISGVLFTSDPVTGSYTSMSGNLVYGMGEQLVSGESNAFSFRLVRPKGKYEGPEDFKKYSNELFKYASRLEKLNGCPQDIEWAVAKGKLFLLQTRPITTLRPGNPDTYEWNDTLGGDFLWVNTNIGEAIPDVFTPLTWTITRVLDNEIGTIPGFYLLSGNICGRAYTNINMRLSFFSAFGVDANRGVKLLGDSFGDMPEGIHIPIYPFSRLGLIKSTLPRLNRYMKKLMKASKNLNQYLKDTPEWCRSMTRRIGELKTQQELLILWREELQPYVITAWFSLLAGASKFIITTKLNNEFIKLVGIEEANKLLSNLSGDSILESLGPVVGISKVIDGTMSRQEYFTKYGHRGPHEFELSIPHLAEDESWLDKQITEFKKSNTDIQGLLEKQTEQYKSAWNTFKERFPDKVKKIEKQIAKASAAAHVREAVRSEFIRSFRVIRVFALKAGELTGIGEDIFFLYLNEVCDLLSGDPSALMHVSGRKKTYEKYKALPPLPSIISGRFDPYSWAKDSKRRADYYDASMTTAAPHSGTLKGFPGAAGRVEGTVRILISPEEGEMLQKGEILVASTTNVGWTPMFPIAGAIVTDIGAPLSHAAIVARELGIPAVVGCGNATTSLKNGDRVIVDGGKGIIEILSKD